MDWRRREQALPCDRVRDSGLGPGRGGARLERQPRHPAREVDDRREERLQGAPRRPGHVGGLEQEARLGVNPFKFGIVGSSDIHNSLSFMEEDNFFGKLPIQEPNPERWEHKSKESSWDAKLGPPGARYTWHYMSAGYAAVWATENTREALWDALKRRETYATSGTRLVVRFFGGFDFTGADAKSRYLADAGYAKVDEIPYDFVRKRLTIVAGHDGDPGGGVAGREGDGKGSGVRGDAGVGDTGFHSGFGHRADHLVGRAAQPPPGCRPG